MDALHFAFRGPGHRKKLMALVGALAALPAWPAERISRPLTVSATVQPYAQLALSQPAQLVLPRDDVRLGYIDVPGTSNPARYSLTVTTNDRAGYALQFGISAALQPMLASVQVSGIGSTVPLATTGGRISVAYTVNKVTFTPTFRFVLNNKARAGTYAWQVTTSVQAN